MSLTNQVRYVRALDTASTVGAGKSGLAFGDITAKYLTQGGELTALTTEAITTLGTYQAPTSAAHIRIKELAGTNPTLGIYEVHFHNDQVSIPGRKLWLYLSAAGAVFQPLEVDLFPPEWQGYANDCVWIDSTNGTAGTTVGINGTWDYPSNSFTSACTIAAARGIKSIKLKPGSFVTVPDATYDTNFFLDLNGGSITPETAAGVTMDGWTVNSSIYPGLLRPEEGLSGETPLYYSHYHDLRVLGNCFVPTTTYCVACRFLGDIRFDGTLSSADSVFVDCYNERKEAMEWDVGGDGGNPNSIIVTGWYGDILLTNLAAGQTFQVYGYGKLTIADSCTGGTVRHTSHIETMNEAGETYAGAVTVDLISDIGAAATAAQVAAMQDTLETISDQIDILASAGSGARTVAVTVNDGSDPIEGVRVRMTKGAESYILSTDADGEAVFSLDDGTWAVAITRSGYSFTGTTLLVDGNKTQTYSMTLIVITSSDPGQVTGYLYCYNASGTVVSGVNVTLMQLRPISGSGIAYDGAARTQTSGVDGLVQFPGLFLGGRYRLYRGTDNQNPVTFTIDEDQTDPLELPSVIDTP